MRTNFEPSSPVATERIFVVESDEVVRSALQFILDDVGETRAFTDLEQAFAQAGDLAPEIVLLGIGLLRSNGACAVAEVARRWIGVRILIVANSEQDPLALAALKLGAHDVLGKPITVDGVRGKVDTLLGPKRHSPAMLGLLPLSAAW